ncbi:MAG: serine/threonine protein kinase [Deltaproteobacteria bacterium]|nr:serine/threonine protein kinase [Deltaproteobacteria bacterium]MBI2500450.1 serine/threonine protein kinase [Deltaproteobacteria bacterium]
MQGKTAFHFDTLLPEAIFKTVSDQGWQPTGSLIPLNSYENRVYEIGLEEAPPLIAKYYRPGRWTQEGICEEHLFLQALAEAEVPVVLPLPLQIHLPEISTLSRIGDFFYAFYPKFRGREHDEITNEDRRWLGRTLARLHNIGEQFRSLHRLSLNPHTYGTLSLEFILSQTFLPTDLKQNVEAHLLKAIELIRPHFGQNLKTMVLHGDCHPGNILWNREGPHLVDFDDMVIAPPTQDLWMLFNGTEEEKREQKENFFEGYEMFRKFDHNTLILSEPLRTLRMIRHAAWIGQRYKEPAFQKAFPYYEERRYWELFLLGIKEQISLLQELG